MKKIAYYMSLVVTGLFMTACNEDFKDWVEQTTYQPEAAVTIPGFTATPSAAVNLNNAGDSVKLLSLNEQTLPAGATLDNLRIVVTPETGGEEITIDALDATGVFPFAALQEAVVKYYGVRPTPRILNAHAYVDVMKDGEASFVDAGTFQITLTPQAPELETLYYITGNINGWDNTNTDYELTNGGQDPYEQPVFTVTIPAPAEGGNVEFKVTPKSGIGGDWSKCLAGADVAGKFNFNNDGGNMVIEAVEDAKFYVLTLNLLEQTYSAEALPGIEEAYYLVGTMNGWDINNTDYELTNGGADPYQQPVFSILLPAEKVNGSLEFKVAPKSGVGNWDECLAATETPGVFAAHNAGGNFVGEVVEGALYYRISLNMMEFTYEITALSFDPYIYFIGATDGWNNDEPNRQKLALTDESGIYTGYIYCADPNGWGNEFKFQKTAGDWGSEINSGHMTGGITGDFADGGGNFKATAGEGVYYVTLNMGTMTLNAVLMQYMGITGDFCGWNEGVEMQWNATDYCYEATGVGITSAGWKFRANGLTDPSWTVNLGGALDDLVQGGSNLSEVGTTIKLYPTRRTSDKIYCTVE